MWTKHISKMNWEDISTICPLCDKRMESGGSYYGSAKCPRGHYELSCGNYHTDFYVEGNHVATTDDMFNEAAYETLERVIPEARKRWRDSQGGTTVIKVD
jgi:hypothetical protein